MKKLISQFVLVLILSTAVFSQSVDNKLELVDEFTNINMGDYLSRLDALAINSYKSNGEKVGLIRVYGSSTDEDYAYPFQRMTSYHTYLIKLRGMNVNRFRFQNCDLSEKTVTTRFFLIPKDSETPNCNENIIIPQKTTKFSTRHYENPDHFYDDPYPDFSGTFPKTENQILNKLLIKLPDAKIVLVGYLGSNVYRDYKSDPNSDNDYREVRKPDSPKLINKILNEQKDTLIKGGIPASKILVINGGYIDSTRNVEIWFVPKGSEIPKPKPDYFRKTLK